MSDKGFRFYIKWYYCGWKKPAATIQEEYSAHIIKIEIYIKISRKEAPHSYS